MIRLSQDTVTHASMPLATRKGREFRWIVPRSKLLCLNLRLILVGSSAGLQKCQPRRGHWLEWAMDIIICCEAIGYCKFGALFSYIQMHSFLLPLIKRFYVKLLKRKGKRCYFLQLQKYLWSPLRTSSGRTFAELVIRPHKDIPDDLCGPVAPFLF